jgi:outer membrane usher protein
MKLKKSLICLAVQTLCATAYASQLPVLLVPTHAADTKIDAIVNENKGIYTISADQLQNIPRVRYDLLPKTKIITLNEIGTVIVDDENGELKLTINPNFLESQIITSNNRTQISIPTVDPITAMILDYDLRLDSVSDKTNAGILLNSTTWLGKTRLDTSLAAATSTQSQVTNFRAVRENLAKSSLYEAGTISAQSGSRSSPGQIIGFGFRKDRGITPGYITSPQIQTKGIAKTRTTIDVLIDNQIKSHVINPGPFDVSIDQASTSGGLTQIIVKDEFGTDKVISAQLWSNPNLLGIGQSEYALSAGRISLGNLQSDGYSLAGYYRRGIKNWLTVETGFESTTFRKNWTAAADVATKIGDFALDVSTGTDKSVALHYLPPSKKIWDWTLNGSATASTFIQSVSSSTTFAANRSTQIGFSVSASREKWTTSATFAKNESGEYFGTSISHSLSSAANLSLSASRTNASNGQSNNSVFLTLSIPIGGKSVSLSTSQTDAGLRKSVSYGGSIGEGVSVGVNGSGVDKIESIGANASFGIGSSSANVGVSQSNNLMSYRTSLRGGMILHEKGVTQTGTGTSSDGFAVVDLGTSGVGILNGYGQKSVTNQKGLAVLRLPALTKSVLTIDADSATDDLDLSTIPATVQRRGGMLIERHPVISNGQLIQVPNAKSGDVLEIQGQLYPALRSGKFWIDLPPGRYSAKINEKKWTIQVKKVKKA